MSAMEPDLLLTLRVTLLGLAALQRETRGED
jgi:hypothetical protein